MKRRTFAFENLKVASPCSADWNTMTGDERVRSCSDCERPVYNLSAMSGREIADLIRETEGRRCIRFYRRKDGTLLTQDCPVGVRKARRRAMGALAAMASMIFGGIGWGMLDRNEADFAGAAGEFPLEMGEMVMVEDIPILPQD